MTQSQIGRAISSHTFLRAVAIFFHVCDHIMSVVTNHINANQKLIILKLVIYFLTYMTGTCMADLAPCHNWLCPLVSLLICWSVTHSFDDPHVAPIGLLGLVRSESNDDLNF